MPSSSNPVDRPETIPCLPTPSPVAASGRRPPAKVPSADPSTRAARLVAVKADPTVLASPSSSVARLAPPGSARRRGQTGALAALVAGALLGLGSLGCGHKIGDSCSSSADCDPSGGNRTCDLAQPGGYCIIEGCDARSCPGEAVCVRFFPEQPLLDPTKACDPAATATCTAAVAACTATPATCAPPAPGVCCEADEVCLPDAHNPGTAACVRTSLEKRACVLSCGDNGDCRGGFTCRTVGTCGTLPLILDPKGTAKYCAPAPASATGALALCPA
jgi:hypothetical protein